MTATNVFPPARIYPLGHPMLAKTCAPVTNFDGVRDIVERMIEYCVTHPEENAAGLAAPQVGVPERFFVFKRDEPRTGTAGISPEDFWWAAVNPEIVEASTETRYELEGCLSVPFFSATVCRPAHVSVYFIDGFTGGEQRLFLDGIESCAFQHEFDHLNGVTIVDLASRNDVRRGGRAIKEAQRVAKKFLSHRL